MTRLNNRKAFWKFTIIIIISSSIKSTTVVVVVVVVVVLEVYKKRVLPGFRWLGSLNKNNYKAFWKCAFIVVIVVVFVIILCNQINLEFYGGQDNL